QPGATQLAEGRVLPSASQVVKGPARIHRQQLRMIMEADDHLVPQQRLYPRRLRPSQSQVEGAHPVPRVGQVDVREVSATVEIGKRLVPGRLRGRPLDHFSAFPEEEYRRLA